MAPRSTKADSVEWLSEREESAWRALQFMHMRLDGHLARQLARDSGLSYPDYVVLVALTDQPEGSMRVYELAAESGWEKSRLSHHLTRMEKRGLIERRRCASDQRGAHAVVTAKGRQEIERAAPGHLQAVRDLFIDRLTPEQLDAVGEVAQLIIDNLDEVEASANPADDPGVP